MPRSKTITVEIPGEGTQEVEILPSTGRSELREALARKGIKIDNRQELAVKGGKKSARHLPEGELYDRVEEGDRVQGTGSIGLGY